MKQYLKHAGALLLGFTLAAAPLTCAAESTVYRTLDEIKESGTINIGVFSDKSPFGYVDENGEYQGYDVYFGNRIGEDLGVEINYVSTEAANRIEYLQTGKVDIILANFTVTEERAQEVDFALPYMNVALGVVSPDSAVITSLDEIGTGDEVIVSPEKPQRPIWRRTIRTSSCRSTMHMRRPRPHLKTAMVSHGLMIILRLLRLRLKIRVIPLAFLLSEAQIPLHRLCHREMRHF